MALSRRTRTDTATRACKRYLAFLAIVSVPNLIAIDQSKNLGNLLAVSRAASSYVRGLMRSLPRMCVVAAFAGACAARNQGGSDVLPEQSPMIEVLINGERVAEVEPRDEP